MSRHCFPCHCPETLPVGGAETGLAAGAAVVDGAGGGASVGPPETETETELELAADSATQTETETTTKTERSPGHSGLFALAAKLLFLFPLHWPPID